MSKCRILNKYASRRLALGRIVVGHGPPPAKAGTQFFGGVLGLKFRSFGLLKRYIVILEKYEIQTQGRNGFLKLINIGFGNIVAANRVIAIVSPESAPIKRMIQEARDKGILIDATFGRRTRAVVVTDSEHIILSDLQPETVANRLGGTGAAAPAPEEEADD